MDIPGYDKWKTKLPKEEIAGYCSNPACGKEIYVGEEVYITSFDDYVHTDCWLEYAKEVLEPELIIADRR